ncbi:uncharacterized protein N0V89_007878 [Didymosphaeria variabile]|uniref:Uncharacterized protein n=1 Tax=Didymosphaeria variabile TaxID=1932322 RepID=A0A9W8XK75_9PLEO|nr:uncharacterized protein N0V89_007878 [Didymosphaeria variabile]KAJ4352529.1 hypothetical protein N0V89_007878 [Didymosphaeria variabile]
MEYGLPPIKPYSPDRLSGYFDAFVHNTRTMQDVNTWLPTLNSLRGQKDYLEELLSKTATTLNALRDRQTRNQRVLDTNPTPRSKRKKIQQNRWRTCKTIHTCENEEKVILDCLKVCENNIHTLEAIICPPETPWTRAEYYSSNSYVDSDTTSFDWQGWTEDVAVSPFEKTRIRPLPLDDIAPDTVASVYAGAETRRPPPPPLRPVSEIDSALPPAPPNSAYTNFTLSPEATAFKPHGAHLQLPVARLTKELDKLTISGFLASKRMDSIRRRRFSDEGVAFLRRSSNIQPALTRASSCHSWPGPSTLGDKDPRCVRKSKLKRTNSI